MEGSGTPPSHENMEGSGPPHSQENMEGSGTPHSQENMEESGPSNSQVQRKRGRGPAKGLKKAVPMFLQYTKDNIPTGDWSKQYGQNLGHCASRINITIDDWKNVEQSEKDLLWNSTKVSFL